MCCLLYSVKSLCPIYVRKQIVHALAYSVVRYGLCCFYFCSSFWKNKIDALLKSILKSVLYGVQYDRSETIFRFSRMPNFSHLFKQTVVLNYVWTKEFCSAYVTVRELRPRFRFTIPWVRTRYGERLRIYYVPSLLNTLPDEVFSLSSRKQIKSVLFDLYK